MSTEVSSALPCGRRQFWIAAPGIALLAIACIARDLGPVPTPTPSTGVGPIAGEVVPVDAPPAGKYLFVETWTIIDGEGRLPALFIDFPGYRFDPAAGTLRNFVPGRSIELGEDQWGLVGRGESRRNDAGGGAFSKLIPVPSLPFTTGVAIFTGQFIGDGTSGPNPEDLRDAPVRILAVDETGAVDIEIDGERHVLPPSGQWTSEVDSYVLTLRWSGTYRVASLVTNYGWQNRALINAP